MCAQVMHFCQVSKITSFYITLFQEAPRFTFQAPPNLASPLRAASVLTHRTHLNPSLFLSKKQENVPKEWGPLGPRRGTGQESLGKLVNILSCSLIPCTRTQHPFRAKHSSGGERVGSLKMASGWTSGKLSGLAETCTPGQGPALTRALLGSLRAGPWETRRSMGQSCSGEPSVGLRGEIERLAHRIVLGHH